MNDTETDETSGIDYNYKLSMESMSSWCSVNWLVLEVCIEMNQEIRVNILKSIIMLICF